MLINPDGTYGYIANGSGNDITVVDISDDTVVTQIPVGNSPTGIG